MNRNLSAEAAEKVYGYVFNKMPIRVIAFDSAGCGPRLLERNAIVALIISRLGQISDLGEENDDDEPNLDYADDKNYKAIRKVARFAILSHTWIRGIPGDVVYGDWATREMNGRGNTKITKFCEVAALEHGVSFGWMDTVCIDKSSSTELDESIRSMYRWYKETHVCITYLAETSTIEDMYQDAWFTRGWTLQELLAPKDIKFYGQDWKLIIPDSTENNSTFNDNHPEFSYENNDTANKIPAQYRFQIWKATTITDGELVNLRSFPRKVPISRIFQLAALRKVTREEDLVYSLMGLLGVGITVAYGEGESRALNRLFREIVLCRAHILDIFNHCNLAGLIPHTVHSYLNRSNILNRPVYNRFYNREVPALQDIIPMEPITFTHLGVSVPMLLVPAFAKQMFREDLPFGSESRTIRFENKAGVSCEYIILNDSHESAQWIADFTSEQVLTLRNHNLVFCGILNFSQGKNEYSIPNTCLCIIVSPHFHYLSVTSVLSIDFHPSHYAVISGPQVFSDQGFHLYTQEQLQKFGIQVSNILVH